MASNNTHGKRREIIPVVLAGGAGTRLWPLSRKNYPKSLLKIKGDNTLLQTILTQIQSIPDIANPLVIGNIDYGTAIAENLKQIKNDATILLETQSLNTATATAIAAHYASDIANNPLLLILPVDQYITDISQFAKMLNAAIQAARNEQLTIFGVKPVFAATDYGYIKRGAKLPGSLGYKVDSFVEKPSAGKAKTYIESGNYYWNSGIFLFSAATFLEELAIHSPKIFKASLKVVDSMKKEQDKIIVNTHLAKDCPPLSIDQAVLQKTKRLVVFPFKGAWHDLGNWNSLYDLEKKDRDENVKTPNVLAIDTSKCYLHTGSQLLVTSGISNLLVVATKDVVLVASRDKTQDIKKLVDHLVKKKHKEAMLSRIVYQTWGYYETVDTSVSPQIKYYYINPGNEYVSKIKGVTSTCWLIVKGKAQITIGKKVQLKSKNESIEISKGKKFKVMNLSKKEILHFIEIYSGGVSVD